MRKGIDVSTYQGAIDWKQVKASGIDWTMIKCSQSTYEAARFAENINKAYANGIQCGVYHFLTARNQAECDAEVDFLLNLLASYKPLIRLYVCLDVESSKLPTDKNTLTAMVRRAYKQIEDAGYKAIVYTNMDWLRSRLDFMGDMRVWLAWWRKETNVPSRSDHPSLARLMLWQYGVGKVDGIAGDVDCNLMLEDETKMINDYAGRWSEKAIEWCKKNNIMQGFPDGSFKPDEPLTREQAAQTMYNFAKYLQSKGAFEA